MSALKHKIVIMLEQSERRARLSAEKKLCKLQTVGIGHLGSLDEEAFENVYSFDENLILEKFMHIQVNSSFTNKVGMNNVWGR